MAQTSDAEGKREPLTFGYLEDRWMVASVPRVQNRRAAAALVHLAVERCDGEEVREADVFGVRNPDAELLGSQASEEERVHRPGPHPAGVGGGVEVGVGELLGYPLGAAAGVWPDHGARDHAAGLVVEPHTAAGAATAASFGSRPCLAVSLQAALTCLHAPRVRRGTGVRDTPGESGGGLLVGHGKRVVV